MSFGHDTHTALTAAHAPTMNSCDQSYFIYTVTYTVKGTTGCVDNVTDLDNVQIFYESLKKF